jgi:hypothetical protein
VIKNSEVNRKLQGGGSGTCEGNEDEGDEG